MIHMEQDYLIGGIVAFGREILCDNTTQKSQYIESL